MSEPRVAVAAVTGRFQPFHVDHLALVRHALERFDRLCVAITNPDQRSQRAEPSSSHRHLETSNPFTYRERSRAITAALRRAEVPAERFDVVPFPLDAPSVLASYVPPDAIQVVRIFSEWERDKSDTLEGYGYTVLRLQGSIEDRVSASDIRSAIAEGRPWQHLVPPGIAEVLLEGGEAALRARCAGQVSGDRSDVAR